MILVDTGPLIVPLPVRSFPDLHMADPLYLSTETELEALDDAGCSDGITVPRRDTRTGSIGGME